MEAKTPKYTKKGEFFFFHSYSPPGRAPEMFRSARHGGFLVHRGTFKTGN